MMFLSSGRGLKLVFALTAALSMAACSKNPDDANGVGGGLGGGLGGAGAGMATPGSQQDFISNVGDRVLFETDSTELTSLG